MWARSEATLKMLLASVLRVCLILFACGLQPTFSQVCAPGTFSGPPNITVVFFSYLNSLVHTFSSTTGMLYVAHTAATTPLIAISTNSSLNITSSLLVSTAGNGLHTLCVRPDGGAVAAAFDNQGGPAMYKVYSGGKSLVQLYSGLGGGQGTVMLACDSVAVPLKAYIQFWGGSQPIIVYTETGVVSGASIATGDSWSSSYCLHSPFRGGALFAIHGGTTNLYRVNASTRLIETTYTFAATWLNARLVWNTINSQLLMGASNSTCSLVIGFDPLSLTPIGPAACVAPAGSLVSLVPSIDANGNLHYITLTGTILRFSFTPLSGALTRLLPNINLGFGLLGSGVSGRGGVIYFPAAATDKNLPLIVLPLLFVAARNSTTAIVVKLNNLTCTPCPAGTFSSSYDSSSCQQCPDGHFCPSGTSLWARLNCGRGNYCPGGSGTPTLCPYQEPPPGGWGALQVQGPAFLVETAYCLNHCFWNFTAGDGKLSKC